jgi:hypothetical protein
MAENQLSQLGQAKHVEGKKFHVAKCEWLGLVSLGAIATYFIETSWLKWPEPLIDFGRELYIPWRLANGAVLYRDADDFYGPLSQYANAALFKLFGPGLLVLVTANLLIFFAILAAIYVLFRRAWGILAATTSSAIFLAVFGFSQLTRGNYNYATPYSHEATHGLLICLVLVIVLSRWVDQATPWRSFISGGLFGLTAVLKPEIMLAAGLVTCVAAGVRVLQQRSLAWRLAVWWGFGAILPMAAFWYYFARYFPWTYSLSLACRGWLNIVASRRFVGDFVQTTFLGIDRPWAHLGEHALCTFAAMSLIAGIGGLPWLASRIDRKTARGALYILVPIASAWLAWSVIDWMEVGRCLLGLTLAYICYEGVFVCRSSSTYSDVQAVQRLLIAVLAAGLMGRMFLYGRIYQFGFYQAALAALLVAAVLVGELPLRLRADPMARIAVAAAGVLLLGIGTFRLAAHSQRLLRAKTFQVGAGIDKFYAFPTSIEPTGELVRLVCEELRSAPHGSTLVVLPEGEMINYLARMPSPIPPFFYFSAATSGGLEDEIVSQLSKHHPDYVVVISRDLREYGVRRYGESYGQGRRILEWVATHYKMDSIYGGNPVDNSQRGAVILTWKG